jgi:predicted glycogen debranching enzyme
MGAQTILDRPLVRFGREVCGDLSAALRREWLVTNGLGGYASGSLAGPNTRRYHGLLVAALAPPVERTVLVAGALEWAEYAGRRYPICTQEYADGGIQPNGYRYLQSFHLAGTLPVWIFALADALLERRIWMAHGRNTTCVRYRLLRGTGPIALELSPLLTYRDFHSLRIDTNAPAIEADPAGITVRAFEGARPYTVRVTGSPDASRRGAYTPGGTWYGFFVHREETARGLDDRSMLYLPGTFTASLNPGESLTLVLSAEPDPEGESAASLPAEEERQRALLAAAGVAEAASPVQQLVLAADAFIVARKPAPADAGASSPSADRTVIAGYHWFNDWGRDTMIALPGLTLATGRPEDAAAILRAFGRFVRDGLLPNNFPDRAGADPGYNTADASLWYPVAIHAYHRATGDISLVEDLLPVLHEIVDHHIAGTRYGIGVDPADGLLRAGEPGFQLTWMDAKIGDWVVTPRIGKPVEINALWYNALHIVGDFLTAGDPQAAHAYRARAEQVRASFRSRFLPSEPGRGLADVVDGPEGDDWTVRPNQIFAVSLPHPIIDGVPALAVVDVVGRQLLTSLGLRSLSPDDPAYRGAYGGGPAERDAVYHQGPVWTWLAGPYIEAHYRMHGDRNAVRALLAPFADHLFDAGLGTISEIAEGDPPHLPRGAIAQAWGVAEILRVWRAYAAMP